MGAQLVARSQPTDDIAGDGTTATLLARAIVHEGLKNVSAGATRDGHARAWKRL